MLNYIEFEKRLNHKKSKHSQNKGLEYGTGIVHLFILLIMTFDLK